MSFCVMAALLCMFIVASGAGVVMGYNYSLSEFIDTKGLQKMYYFYLFTTVFIQCSFKFIYTNLKIDEAPDGKWLPSLLTFAIPRNS